MSNEVKFKINGLTSALTNEYVRVTDTSRLELFSGEALTTDANGNAVVNIGSAGTVGQEVLVYGDNFKSAGIDYFKGACGGGVIESVSGGLVTGNVINLSYIEEIAWFTDNYTVYADGTTDFKSTETLEEFTGTNYYVGYDGASDTNDGLTEQTSWKTISHAVDNGSDTGRVYINAGDYWKENCWAKTFGMPNGQAYIADGVVNIWGCAEDDTLNFALDGTYTNTYSWTTDEVFNVLDGSLHNSYLDDISTNLPDLGRMTQQSSIDLVNSTANSWCYISGKLYVRTHDDRAPDIDIKVMTHEVNRMGSDNASEYWQGVNFVGVEVSPSSFFKAGTVTQYKVHQGYTGGASNTAVGNAIDAYMIREDCIVISGNDDLISGRGTINILDINCIAADAPVAGSTNCSTFHDNVNGIRLGGQYYDASSKVVGNIQSGLALHVGVNSYKTYDVGFTANDSDYGMSADTEGHFYNCTTELPNGSPSLSTYSVYGGGTIYTQGNSFSSGYSSSVVEVPVVVYEQ